MPRRDRAGGTAHHRGRRGRAQAAENGLPRYTPDIALRSIDGHLTRTGTQVMAWYRLAAQAWSFRSDAQREALIRQIAAQFGELHGRWLHLRVTTRPYPVHMWAEAFDNNALGRMPDVAGSLGWDGFLEGEQRHLMGLSMSDKEVFLGIEVSGRSILDRWVEKASPVLGRVVPGTVRAELAALTSEVAHVDTLVAGAGLDAVPATAGDIAWLMHRSCALGLPAPRAVAGVPNGVVRWETEDLATFTDGVEMHQEPYAPTVRVVGKLRSKRVERDVAVLTVGLMEGLRIPEVDDPWMQHSDRLPFPVEWSARIYVRRPEEVAGELQRQMGKVRSQIRHYTHDHDLDPPMSLARQADRVLAVEDELTSGLTQLNTRLYGWWRIAVSGKDEAEAVGRAQQVLDVYRPKVQIEHPEAQYRYAREFIPGEPLASTAYRRRGSVTWAAAAVPAATASVGDRRGIMIGETCTATRRPVAWDPWLAQEVRRASGLTAIVGGLGSGKALALDTPLPTPAGWTTMGEVEVGDELLGRDGRPTRVVAATGIMHGRPCYVVHFSDGSAIRADAKHEWLVQADRAHRDVTVPTSGRVHGAAAVCTVEAAGTVRTTESIASAMVRGRRTFPVDHRSIVDVVPVESVPVRCVQVDDADHLYLAGASRIPTHNSFLTGSVVYKTLRMGARWTVLDPSGPLARLAELPELAPFSRHINLLRADPGILNPYRVVAEPRPEHFLDDDDPERAWRRERSLAAATRRRLVLDVLTGLLPFEVARLPHTRIVLLRAVREVGGAADRHPGLVIDALRRHARDGADHSGVVADFLEERRELPQAALLFPDTSRDDPWQADRDYRLTVLTMQGMTLPRPGSPREEWTDGESLAVELLNLASWLTQRTIYDADRNIRKGVALDETHFLSQVPTGKVLIDRLARDSRKFNVRALFASQLAGDLLRVSGFASLVNAVFVGRTDDAEAQQEALRLLKVPTDVGYEAMLGTLSPRPRHDDRVDDTPRQFIFADGHGGVEKIRIDLEAPHLEHVREALDTNPDASRVSARGVPAPPVRLDVAGSAAPYGNGAAPGRALDGRDTSRAVPAAPAPAAVEPGDDRPALGPAGDAGFEYPGQLLPGTQRTHPDGTALDAGAATGHTGPDLLDDEELDLLDDTEPVRDATGDRRPAGEAVR